MAAEEGEVDSEVVGTYMGVEVKFRDVWQDNLEQQFEVIRNILDDYPYVGMVRRCPLPSQPPTAPATRHAPRWTVPAGTRR
jgi:hypothetical protein